MNAFERPTPVEVFSYYDSYIAKAPGHHLLTSLTDSMERAHRDLRGIPEERGDNRYAPGKWTIKEVVQHVLDTERIFCYRALCFARQDRTELPGFDENQYAPNADTSRRRLADIILELGMLRASTIELFRSFNEPMLLSQGVANGNRMSVRALGWTISGHTMHHLDVLEQRY